MWDLLAVIGRFLLALLGLGRRPSPDERHEAMARDLGRQEALGEAARAAAEAHAKAAELEARMARAQAQAGQTKPAEEPHAGTDLFYQD